MAWHNVYLWCFETWLRHFTNRYALLEMSTFKTIKIKVTEIIIAIDEKRKKRYYRITTIKYYYQDWTKSVSRSHFFSNSYSIVDNRTTDPLFKTEEYHLSLKLCFVKAVIQKVLNSLIEYMITLNVISCTYL